MPPAMLPPPEGDDDSEYDRFMDRVLRMIQPDFTRTKLNYMLSVKDKWWTVKLVLFVFLSVCLSLSCSCMFVLTGRDRV